jgi:hypothetical protein
VIQDIEQNEEHLRWGAFVQAIKEQFEPVHTTKTARSRLDQLKQKTSVRNYNTEFRAIMLQLPAMHEDDRIHAYIKGLKPAVASLVAMQQPGTLLLAQQLADTADTIQFQQLPKRTYDNRWNDRPTPRPNHQGPSPMDLDAIGRLTDVERERLRKIGGCFRCRKTGHLARDCTLTNRQHPRINAIEELPEESGKE